VSLLAVDDHAALVSLTGGDAWVRWALDPAALPPTWHDPAAGLVAISRPSHVHGTSLVLLPAPGASAERALPAAAGLLDRIEPRSVTVPRAAAPTATRVLPAIRRLAAGRPAAEWDWMWTTDAPPPGGPAASASPEVATLDVSDPAVSAARRDLLDRYSPRHSARPGNPEVAGWVGVRRSGRILACAAWFEEVPGIPLLASVAVHPDARREGLGSAVTAAVTRRALAAGARAVTVDLYADSHAPRRIYLRLGFATARRFSSWTASEPRPDPT